MTTVVKELRGLLATMPDAHDMTISPTAYRNLRIILADLIELAELEEAEFWEVVGKARLYALSPPALADAVASGKVLTHPKMAFRGRAQPKNGPKNGDAA